MANSACLPTRAPSRASRTPRPGARALRTLRIYRFDPDGGGNPRLDTFQLDASSCGPMVLDA